MLDLLDLIDDQVNALHETLRIMVMQDVHINTLISASEKRIAELVCLDAASYRR